MKGKQKVLGERMVQWSKPLHCGFALVLLFVLSSPVWCGTSYLICAFCLFCGSSIYLFIYCTYNQSRLEILWIVMTIFLFVKAWS